ncbi:MAG: hypothetical protein KDA28_09535, partial [Phycisphaerales bacterium]|nr:hypothetical protein [Phycisphaerales bacterium]
MKFHGVFPLLLALVPTGAAASDLSLGLGLGVLHDLTPRKGDARLDDEALPVASCDDTFGTDGTYNCGPNSPLSLLGGRIAVPIRYALTDRTVLRFGPRVEYGGRSGRVIFQCTDDIDVCNERSTDFPDFTLTNGDDVMGTKHWAYSVTAMAAVGTEISIPVGESNIYFGGEIAGGMVFTMESLGPDESGDKSPTDGVLDKYRHPKDGV